MSAFLDQIAGTLEDIRAEGLWKAERAITGPQGARVTRDGREMINLCANNYLGLAAHPELVAAAAEAMARDGYGMASVRFICGTATHHRALEAALADFLSMEDTILFAACFDANAAVFEPLLTAEDAVVSDALNHASIIDGIRLCKARRYRYANSDMGDLEAKLSAARDDGARHVMIATDGVFSMDGHLARLPEIRALADRYDAQLLVDDCHATGFVGATGAGTPEHFGVRADILTGTLGKALGGAIGGYVAGPRPVIDLLRQRARPYLFSNALPPAVTAAGLRALELVRDGAALRQRLDTNTTHWRRGLSALGFRILDGEHPIVPVMLGEARLAQEMAAALDRRGVYVSGFFFPVVPRGQARLRTQMSAALTRDDLDIALDAFAEAGRDVGAIR